MGLRHHLRRPFLWGRAGPSRGPDSWAGGAGGCASRGSAPELRPDPGCSARPGCSAGRTMFSRKKRELMKTPSISKKNRAGSPSPQPSAVSEPFWEERRVGTLEPQGDRVLPVRGGGHMLGLRGGARQPQPPPPGGTSQHPGIGLMAGVLWVPLPPSSGPGLAVGRREWVAEPGWGQHLLVGSVRWGSGFGGPVLWDVRAVAQRSV